LPHAAPGVNEHCWRLVDKQVTGLLLVPCYHQKQTRPAPLNRGQHPVPGQGVEGVLPVDLQSNTAGGNACSEGVASHLAAPLDAMLT
jgi:hypothetical protein